VELKEGCKKKKRKEERRRRGGIYEQGYGA
jgi:hypothetical protein